MYDLIIRDATIVSSQGRIVADVAIKDGVIAYVGPMVPNRGAKKEISAIGRFLIPGLIDTAVQFEQADNPESWTQESKAAVSGGITTVLALPNQKVPVVDTITAKKQLKRAKGKSWCNYGLWGAALYNNARELEKCHQEGLIHGVFMLVDEEPEPFGVRPDEINAFNGHPSVLAMSLPNITQEKGIRTLLGSFKDAEKKVHMLHMTTQEELQLLDPVRGNVAVTGGVTPHHLFLSEDEVDVHAPRFSNTNVCAEQDRRGLWAAVKRGRMNCISSSHSPLTADPHGIPGSELLFSLMMSAVNSGNLTLERLVSLCCEAPAKIFNLETKGKIEKGMDADLVLFCEGVMNRIESGDLLSSASWSPYLNKEMAPKPELVIVAGEPICQGGSLIPDTPSGRWIGSETA